MRQVDVGDGLTAIQKRGLRANLTFGQAGGNATDALGITNAERGTATGLLALRG